MSTTAEPPGRGGSSRLQQSLTAAHLYYMQDLTMEAIAQELHTSRSSVSRLLSHARATGLVDIQIRPPGEAAGQLAASLRERFGIRAHLVPMPDHTSEVDRLERVAMSAARLLPRLLDSNITLGVAWGSTITAVSRHLVPRALSGAEVVQLNGAGNIRTTGIVYASEILRRFAGAYGAHVQQFPVPAFFDDPITRAALWRERSTRRVLEVQDRMDVALFSLGSLFSAVPSHVHIGGYLDEADYASLSSEGVVGDVATVFYREDGTWEDVTMNGRASGPGLDRLAKVPRRVCVVSGPSKLASVRGALAADLVTDLVLDEPLARALVD